MSNVTKEQIEHLRALIDKGTAALDEAAQYAGENGISLRYVDENYEEPEDGEEDDGGYEDEYFFRFGGQPFTLEGYKGNYHWYNSNRF